jgi:DNA segregation ATPase FtsK/SpoIIIE, S-DNA-T family
MSDTFFVTDSIKDICSTNNCRLAKLCVAITVINQWFDRIFTVILLRYNTFFMPKQTEKNKKKTPAKKSGKKGKTNHVIVGLLFLLCALLAAAGMLGKAGAGGFLFANLATWLLGAGAIVFPLAFAVTGILIIRKRGITATTREWLGGTVGIIALLALISTSQGSYYGGLIGQAVATPFIIAFDQLFASIVLAVIAMGAFVIFFDRTPKLFPFFESVWAHIRALFAGKQSDDLEDEDFPMEPMQPEPLPEDATEEEKASFAAAKAATPAMKVTDASASDGLNISTKRHSFGTYTPPPMSLLESDRGKANVGDVKANANIIRRTLANFGIEVEMDEVTIGPTVTRYALKPAQGVKLSRIVGLQSDLALALAAHPIRIEAPIPGKSLVGIEIPNKTKATVGLATLLSDPAFSAGTPLLAAVGRNIAGKPVFKSIAKMPHLLIAGTTGSGKSVTIHAIITSLLYRHGPDDLRFIFVDPKRVELTLYNSIPHLLTPVITDSKKAILSLKWAATEMNRRYDILESESVRDIDSYHKKVETGKIKGKDDEEPDRMPYIVIVIDELADIMTTYPREMEAAIVRLAQMSRAVGIHLVLSTQRPEVNVITGLIKANVPSRIALRVPTQIDSRTILDAGGAEKLLGQGDMLAILNDNQPERIQSAYITEDEVKGVVHYFKEAYKDDIRDSIELTGSVSGERTMFDADMDGNGDDDELYEEARTIIIEAGKASTSYIQRKLKVGYARAARLMDMLEERGVISGADGAKPREVLVDTSKSSVIDEVAQEVEQRNNEPEA